MDELDFSMFDEESPETTGLGEEEMDFSMFDEPSPVEEKIARTSSPIVDSDAVKTGAFQGASLGFIDELAGGLEAAGQAVGLKGVGGEDLTDIGFQVPSFDFAENYKKAVEQRRNRLEELNKKAPGSVMTGETLGTFASPGALGKTIGRGGLNILAQALGTSEDADAVDIGQQGLITGAISLGAEKAVPVAGKLLKGIHKGIGEPLEDLLKAFKATRGGKKIFGEPARRAAEEEVQKVSTDAAGVLSQKGRDLAKKQSEVLRDSTNVVDIYNPFAETIDKVNNLQSIDPAMAGDVKKITATLRNIINRVGGDKILSGQADPRVINDVVRELKDIAGTKFGETPKLATDKARNIISDLERQIRASAYGSNPELRSVNKDIEYFNNLLRGIGLEDAPRQFDPKIERKIGDRLQTITRGLEKETDAGAKARQSFNKLQETLPPQLKSGMEEASTMADLTRKAQGTSLFNRGQITTGALVGKLQNMVDWPSNQIASLASKAKPGSTLQNSLMKLANEKTHGARNAILFSLQQNPAYRQFFRENGITNFFRENGITNDEE